ncbi:hypothetical protein UFOVP117_321 [uncultured Caudovirales phage]|uniref:Uncharacterized protein n=1 Tax=uncultured Caudovirales phage TaxID=2100421 RepID=A0A6J5LA00_9CAUD|nr:hypothetical protein UFOVP117_321 [uncultured Caudovirales phage]
MSQLYQALKDFTEGLVTANFVRYEDDEDILRITRVNEKNLGKSLVYLTFDTEDYVKLFSRNSDENNNAYLIKVAFQGSYYGGNIFVDEYSMDYDWDEGYLLNYFNDENLDKIKEIVKILRPSLSVEDLRNHNDKVMEICKWLKDEFSDEISSIVYDYTTEYDEALVKGLRNYITSKLCNALIPVNIFEKKCANLYMTTVSIILNTWDKSGEDKDGKLSDMIKTTIDQLGLEFDEDLYEDYYSYFDSKNFDDEGFNRSVGWNLDKIITKIEDSDNFDSYRKNSDLREKLSKLKYGDFNEWYEFPPQKTFGEKTPNKFIIKDVDDGKILITYTDYERNEFNKTVKIDYETFLNFLYHPELF